MLRDDSIDEAIRHGGGDAEDEALQVESGEGDEAEEEGAVAAALDDEAAQGVPGSHPRIVRKLLLIDEAVSES